MKIFMYNHTTANFPEADRAAFAHKKKLIVFSPAANREPGLEPGIGYFRAGNSPEHRELPILSAKGVGLQFISDYR